jgi:hypothetical protein
LTVSSDIRLKRDIVLLDHLDNGLGLYRYRYLWSEETYVGVMAQEVAEVVPEAVLVGPDGYLRVAVHDLERMDRVEDAAFAARRLNEAVLGPRLARIRQPASDFAVRGLSHYFAGYRENVGSWPIASFRCRAAIGSLSE